MIKKAIPSVVNYYNKFNHKKYQIKQKKNSYNPDRFIFVERDK